MTRLPKAVACGLVLCLGIGTSAAAQTCPSPAETGSDDPHVRFVETHLQPPVIAPGERPYSLAERMRLYEVPALSVAVIHDGRIAWTRAWGVRDTGSCTPVTADTVFQAASISKVATAVLALRLAQQGRIALDRDIGQALVSWRLPRDEALAPNGVTLRQLLSHSAGLGVHGFPGYPVGSALPRPVQILDGAPPANSPPVRSELPAGREWRYSGGGYVLVQVALTDATGLSFAELAERDLFGPLDMTRSAFAQPPSASLRTDLALGHVAGKPIPGGFHVYPELAPAGLWTTAGDLARLLIDIQASVAGEAGHRLTPDMAREMLKPMSANWATGPMVWTRGAVRFGHDGLNEGYQTSMIAYAGRGEGIVLLTNGGQGRRLMDEVVRAVATDYGWTEIAPPAAPEIALTMADAERLAGHYAGGGLVTDLIARPDGLNSTGGVPAPERLQALSPTRFRSAGLGLVIEIAEDLNSFDIVEGGPPITLVRQR